MVYCKYQSLIPTHTPNSKFEEWRYIDGFPFTYQVSDQGRIRRVRKTVPPLVLTPYKGSSGYLLVTLCRNGKRHRKLVQRLVAESFLGPSVLQVNHKNGIKTDNALANLEYVTASGNKRHADRTGLTAKSYRLRPTCSHGHPLIPANIRWSKDSRHRRFRACRTCGRLAQRRYALRRQHGSQDHPER